jgi:hypothetical protein
VSGRADFRPESKENNFKKRRARVEALPVIMKERGLAGSPPRRRRKNRYNANSSMSKSIDINSKAADN